MASPTPIPEPEIPDLDIPTHRLALRETPLGEIPVATQFRARQDRVLSSMLAGGGAIELLLGLAAMALSILGLAGAVPVILAAIAVMVIGAALVAYSGALAVQWRAVLARLYGEPDGSQELIGAFGAETMGGGGAVLLGILALIGLDPVPLLCVAAIGLGGALVYGGAGQSQLDVLVTMPDARTEHRARLLVRGAAGGMTGAGLAGGILAILGVIDVPPEATLVLVATLAYGAALAIAGAASAFRGGTQLWPLIRRARS